MNQVTPWKIDRETLRLFDRVRKVLAGSEASFRVGRPPAAFTVANPDEPLSDEAIAALARLLIDSNRRSVQLRETA